MKPFLVKKAGQSWQEVVWLFVLESMTGGGKDWSAD